MDWPAATAMSAGSVVLLIALPSLVARVLGLDLPERLEPHGARMSALTALTLGLLAATVLLLSAREFFARHRAAQILLKCAATLALVLGLLRLAGHLFSWNLGLDGLGLPSAARAAPATMSVMTATAVALLGAAVLAAADEARGRLPQGLGLAAILIGWLGLSRHLFGGEPLFVYATLSLATAVCVLLLAVGVLSARGDTGLVKLLSSSAAGGTLARQLLPAAVLVPVVAGWLRLKAQHAGWFGTEAGLSLYAITNVAVFGGFVWASARALERTDEARQQRAAEARAGQRLIQSIVDNSAAVIYAKDLEGRYLLVNRLFGELFERDPATVIGRTDHELFPAEGASAYRDMDQRVASAGQPLIEEESVTLPDGVHTYVSVKCPLRDDEGRVSGVFGISTDITARKAAEARLAQQLGRLRLLDEITSAIGERQDLRSIYQVAVRSLEERLPVDFCCVCAYEPVDRALTVTCVGARSGPLALQLAMTEHASITVDPNGLSRCVAGELVYEPDIAGLEFAFPRRLHGAGLRSLVCAPLQSESRVFGVLVAARHAPDSFSSQDCEFVRQLSAHVALAARQAELHSALQRAYDELRSSQQSVLQHERLRALGQMASGIAHDINNAISPAALYVESLLAQEQGLSERGRVQLRTVSRAVDDVAATVARMREFYRQPDATAALSPVNLNPLVLEVAELTRARWSDMPQRGGAVIRLHTDLADGLPAVPGVDSELREALTNLVFNAVDAMPDGGDLSLRTRLIAPAPADRRGARVVAEIQDTGIGMDEATRRRCLEPFFTTKGERGTGLGLAMVYGAVQRHGADLEIESTPGVGTTARIVFAAVAAPGRLAANAPQPAPAPSRKLHLLIVDDDPVLLNSLTDLLEGDGHSVVAAAGGQAAIDLFTQARTAGALFDAVLTDLGMPYVDGRRVASAVKGCSAATPVLMLTGWGRPLARSEVPPHVDRVLGKPPKMLELRAALAELTQSEQGDAA